MRLKDLLHGLSGIRVLGSQDVEILDLTLDSRQISEGSLFCAMTGTKKDGHEFIYSAIEKGAVCVLCEHLPDETLAQVTYIEASDIRDVLGFISSEFFGNPSAKLKIVAVTGTNGKTSIATWLYELVRSMGYPAGLLSTIRILIEGKEFPSTHTTPDVISVHKYLSYMVDAGCEYVFMEASSHALDQRRLSHVSLSGAIFTNISRDHLDYHHDFQSYIAAKKLLFDELEKESFALVNADDKNAKIMLQNCQAQKSAYSIERQAEFKLKVLEQHPDGMLFVINQQELWVHIMGSYNAQNLAAVYGSAVLMGLDIKEILQAISALQPVEGRLEIVPLGKQITGIVDYAHTPDALINVLKTLDEIRTNSRKIITVIGAGGDRDPGKRQDMAKAAIKGSDQVILTSDNPRTEDPEKILDDMEAGINDIDQSRVLRISDRRAAIKTAVTIAQPGDIVLVAGKGHETYQDINGVKYPFDDCEELKKLIYKD